jgi:dihydroflavonol-4-reductase
MARLTGRSGRITLEGVRMSRKRMFFSSAKAQRELDYQPRPAARALEDAVRWFRQQAELSGAS